MCIISINEEEPITAQGELDELNNHQTPRRKSNIKINLCRRKRYQLTYLEDTRSIFDQVIPVVSHLEFRLPKKPPTPNNIVEGLSGPQRQLWKKSFFSILQEQKCHPSFISRTNQISP